MMCRVRLILSLLAIAVHGQPKDLTTMSLEEFLNVEVTSVRKSRQRLSRTAMAIHVITQDDIRRSGATNLPEALRLAPGVHVSRVNGATWAVSIRGFGSFYANKLLVMIDGRTIYSPVMSGVEWSRHLVMMEDIERIEVIRGPAGSVWGANAVSGVINVITKPAAETHGTLVSARSGSRDPLHASARFGAKAGNAAWRTWMHHATLGQARIGDLPDLRPWTSSRAGMRIDYQRSDRDAFVLEAEGMDNRASQYITTYPGPFQSRAIKYASGGPGGFARGGWRHTTGRWGESRLHTYLNVDSSNLGAVTLDTRTWDADFQHTVEWRRGHNVVAGGGFRVNRISTSLSDILSFSPAAATYTVANVFLQEDWEIAPEKLTLSLGGKIERYTFAGSAFQPTARASWTPSNRQTYWAAASGAVRAPSHTDFAIRFPIGQYGNSLLPVRLALMGDRAFAPERLKAFEAGARWQLLRRVVAEWTVYRHLYTGLQAFQLPGPPERLFMTAIPLGAATPGIPTRIVNGRNGRNTGWEATVHVDVSKRWRVSGYHAEFRGVELPCAAVDVASTFSARSYFPKHQTQVRSSWELARRWSAELVVHGTSALEALDIAPLGAWTRVDFRVAHRVGEHFELSVDGKNLARPRQQEYLGNWLYPTGSMARSISAGFRWEK
jgi:iron complex outermembrane receptor protein